MSKNTEKVNSVTSKSDAKIKLPKSFTVGQQKIDVQIVPPREMQSTGALGRCMLSQGKILISSEQTESCMMNTFVHECIHAALDTAGYYDESNDEALVSSLAGFLLEIYNSAK